MDAVDCVIIEKRNQLSGRQFKYSVQENGLIFNQIFLAVIAVLWSNKHNKRNGGDILWKDQKSTKSNLRMMS